MAKYVLWGKREDGLNEVQSHNVQLPTRSGLWHSNDTTIEESLDALLESPLFKESEFSTETRVPTKKVREVFDRKLELSRVPDSLRDTLESLFEEIDTLELGINYYELAHSKRVTPPRANLIARFTEAERVAISESASAWTQYQYLKKRHLLVELRRQQYTLRDSYAPSLLNLRPTPPQRQSDSHLEFGADITVLPIGLNTQVGGSHLVFQPIGSLNPLILDESTVSTIVKYYWRAQTPTSTLIFDFRNLDHVYQLFQFWEEFNDSIDELPADSNLKYLFDTLTYYIDLADLNEIQIIILNSKIKKIKNVDIAYDLNHQFNKSYTPNYISTVFKQKIIPKINAAAAYHASVIENLPYTENFKRCTRCGQILLRDTHNFMRRTSAKDGFGSRCKKCEKEMRGGNKK